MMARAVQRLLLSMAVLLAAFGHSPAQQAASPPLSGRESEKAVAYSFVSPNTRENLTLEEAVKLLASREETELVNSIQRLSRCLGLRPMVSRAIGSWADGAEHSTLFRVYTDRPTLLYEDARLGRLERQKAVLYFRLEASGKGVMYILYPRRAGASLASIARTLDQSGVEFRTLIPGGKRRTVIYVVDLKGELRKQVALAARRLNARLVSVRGTGEFVGDDADREKAQQVFDAVIKEYEQAHPKVGRKCSQ